MMRCAVAFFGLLAVAGCFPNNAATPTRAIALAQGEVIATSPDGYCVDNVATQLARDFAVLAPCVSLGAQTPAPNVVGVATVQVGPAESGRVATDEFALRDYLTTDDGARLLSRTGDASDIDILSLQAFNDRVMIYFTDAAPPPVAGLQQEEWRAFTNINGRLVTIGVRGLAIAPLSEGPGATLLKLVLAGIGSAASTVQDAAADI